MPGIGASACGTRMSPTGMCIAVLPVGLNFRSFIRFLEIMSKPQNVKNRCVSTPSPSAALARISPGYAMSRLPLEQMMASLRPLPASSSKLGTMGVLMTVSSRVQATWSDAAAGLGQAGDVGHLLGRLLGEQCELVLGRKAADGLHPPGGGRLALGGEVLAQELEDLPVLGGELDADRGGELTAEHWKVLEFLRKDFATQGETATTRRVQTVGGFATKDQFALFPKKPAKKMAYIAGLPKPRGCV